MKSSKSEQHSNNFSCSKCGKVYKYEKAFLKHTCVVKKETFQCQFCSKILTNEKAALQHSCKLKKRYEERNTPYGRIAFNAFSKMVKQTYRTETSYEKFIKSRLYNSFIKFGNYVVGINAVSPSDFVDFVIKSNFPLDDWCSDSTYMKYIQHLVWKETPERALERTAIFMQKWADEHDINWSDFFRMVPTSNLANMVKMGKVSPWVMLNCDSGKECLVKFTDEQILMVSSTLNTKMWINKFGRHKDSVIDLQNALREEGL